LGDAEQAGRGVFPVQIDGYRAGALPGACLELGERVIYLRIHIVVGRPIYQRGKRNGRRQHFFVIPAGMEQE
jgi:hypothetical protein